MPPFLSNYSLGYTYDEEYNIYNIAEKLQRLLDENNITIKGSAVRCRCEPSPEKRRMWHTYYAKIDYFKQQLPDNKWAKCERSMSLYSLPTYDQVKHNHAGGYWMWHAKGCRLAGLDDGGNITEEKGAKRHAGGADVDAPMEEPVGVRRRRFTTQRQRRGMEKALSKNAAVDMDLKCKSPRVVLHGTGLGGLGAQARRPRHHSSRGRLGGLRDAEGLREQVVHPAPPAADMGLADSGGANMGSASGGLLTWPRMVGYNLTPGTQDVLAQFALAYALGLDESWVDQLAELAGDMAMQTTEFPDNVLIVGGNWNLDPRGMSDAAPSNERHEHLKSFLQDNYLVIKYGASSQDNSEAAATSSWTHPVSKTMHHRVLDWFAVSEAWEECTKAMVHMEPTGSDHQPVLLEREESENPQSGMVASVSWREEMGGTEQ